MRWHNLCLSSEISNMSVCFSPADKSYDKIQEAETRKNPQKGVIILEMGYQLAFHSLSTWKPSIALKLCLSKGFLDWEHYKKEK